MADDILDVLRPYFDWRDEHDPSLYRDAYKEIERLRADRDRWRALAEYLCQNAPSVVVPDEIACQFPDPLVVRYD